MKEFQMPTPSKPRWTAPAWLAPYVAHLTNTGVWITPDHAMNCPGNDCNLEVNAPRALLCTAVHSQVSLLLRLHAAGLLAAPAPER